MGWDDAAFMFVFALLFNVAWKSYQNAQEVEKLKAEAKTRCGGLEK